MSCGFIQEIGKKCWSTQNFVGTTPRTGILAGHVVGDPQTLRHTNVEGTLEYVHFSECTVQLGSASTSRYKARLSVIVHPPPCPPSMPRGIQLCTPSEDFELCGTWYRAVCPSCQRAPWPGHSDRDRQLTSLPICVRK